MRSLLNLYEGRRKVEWDHTSAICTTIINMHRDPTKSKFLKLDSLNPYRRNYSDTKKPAVKLNVKDSMNVLKSVFVDKKLPNLEQFSSDPE